MGSPSFAAIARRADAYRQSYGEVPTYKAGLHVGEVMTAEAGTVELRGRAGVVRLFRVDMARDAS